MSKVLLVGEQNPYSRDPQFALYPWPENSAGGRLARLLGLGRAEYLRRFDRANLLGHGEKWSAPAARERARQLLGHDGPVVLLGKKVAAAFGLGDLPAFTTSGRFLVLPHPSGRCRVWNDPEAAEKLRRAVDELEDEALYGPRCSRCALRHRGEDCADLGG